MIVPQIFKTFSTRYAARRPITVSTLARHLLLPTAN